MVVVTLLPSLEQSWCSLNLDVEWGGIVPVPGDCRIGIGCSEAAQLPCGLGVEREGAVGEGFLLSHSSVCRGSQDLVPCSFPFVSHKSVSHELDCVCLVNEMALFSGKENVAETGVELDIPSWEEASYRVLAPEWSCHG